MRDEHVVRKLSAMVNASNAETVAGRIGVSVGTIRNWLSGKLPKSKPMRDALESAIGEREAK